MVNSGQESGETQVNPLGWRISCSTSLIPALHVNSPLSGNVWENGHNPRDSPLLFTVILRIITVIPGYS